MSIKRIRRIFAICCLTFTGLSSCGNCEDTGDDLTDRDVSAPAIPPTPAVALTAGGHHACALLEGGVVVCWGDNSGGQLGDGSTFTRTTPVELIQSGKATEIHAGFASTCIRMADGGGLRCAGRLLPGAIEGDQHEASLPPTLGGAKQVLTARLHGCALRDNGEVRCWGGNHFGQLADGMATGCGKRLVRSRPEPAPVPGVSQAVAIALGDTGACALLESSTVQCWGQAGIPEPTLGPNPRCAPVTIVSGNPVVKAQASAEPLDGVKQVVVGGHHGCALRDNGEVLCWGANAIGQLGILREGTTPIGHGAGSKQALQTPTSVTGIEDAVEIASFGRAHTCARRQSGQVMCWGRNREAQLGDGTTTDRFAPVAVSGLASVSAIAAGYDFSCAISHGEVYCWGDNDHGQLGDGTKERRLSPVKVALWNR